MAPGSLFLMVAAHLVLLIQFSEERSDNTSLSYRAAVVEYSAPLGITMDNKEAFYQRNVETFAHIAKRAAELNCDIIVFPEQGLQSIDMPKLKDGSPAIVTRVPAPEEMVNPCTGDESGIYKDLKALSCAARENSIYLVVNVAEMVQCSSLKDQCYCPSSSNCPAIFRPCPASDIFTYNTNVAFDREGTVIARYRKYHLQGEFPLVQTAEPEHSVFDTDFGVRFGMVISFDISFQEPAIKLVNELGARDIVFSTAWFSEMPFQTACQYQAAWAHAMDVNFLASGYNYPEYGTGGSGIYAGRMGTLVAVAPQVRGNYLLVSTIIKKTSPCYDQFFQILPRGQVIPLPSETGGEPAPPYEYDRDYPVGLPVVEFMTPSQTELREFVPSPDRPLQEVLTIKDLHKGGDDEYLEEALLKGDDEERFSPDDEEEEAFEEPKPEDSEEQGSYEGEEGEYEPGVSDLHEDDAEHFIGRDDLSAQPMELENLEVRMPEDLSAQPTELENLEVRMPEDFSAQPTELENLEVRESEDLPAHTQDVRLEVREPKDLSARTEEQFLNLRELETLETIPGDESQNPSEEGDSQYVRGSDREKCSDLETRLPHPCIEASRISNYSKKWLPYYVYPQNAIGSGLHVNRERLDGFSTFMLTSENMKENSSVTVCHGNFCCDFYIVMYSGVDRNTPHYYYRLVVFDGVRSMNDFGEGRYQVCGVITCTTETLDSCGQFIKDTQLDVNYTVFHELHIRGTFKSNNTIVGANTVAHNLLPLPASKFHYDSQSISQDELCVKMESAVSELTFLTFGIYGRNYDVDDFRINKVVCEV